MWDGGSNVNWDSRSKPAVVIANKSGSRRQRWMKLDIERVVTKGTYGPAQDASAWRREPIDLGKVDEVGFADLIPGSSHGAGGYVNVASFEVYGKPVRRH